MNLPRLLLLFFGLGCQASQAQSPVAPIGSGTVYLGIGAALPWGRFQEAYPGGQALGPAFGVLAKPGPARLPFEVGVEVSYLVDGISRQEAQALTPSYTVKTTHSYIPLHAVFRLKPRRTRTLTPYADGLAGITIFNSRSKIKEDIFSSGQADEPAVLDKYNSTVFSYGLAAGLLIKGKKQAPRLDLRLVYLESPLGTYVKRGNLSIDQQGYPVYRFTHSETSMLLLQLHVAGILPGP
jgi:hypothetical protein